MHAKTLRIQVEKAFDYCDISLVPTVLSEIDSRADIKVVTHLFGTVFTVPIIASPMQDVCESNMATSLAMLGGLGVIHRFMSIDLQVKNYKESANFLVLHDIYNYVEDLSRNIACAIGVKGDFLERTEALYKEGCRIFCLDTANGFNISTAKALKEIRANFPDIYIIAGNTASHEGYSYLADLGVDAVRVGIAGGSVCETRTETGVYMPMASAVMKCSILGKQAGNYKTAIIADGGIKQPQDFVKALALGADMVMCGSILAGTKQSPGAVLSIEGKLMKLYRGAASFSAQNDFISGTPDYVEGRESLVPYTGELSKITKRFMGGLQSAMSYMNSKSIVDLQKNSKFVYLK